MQRTPNPTYARGNKADLAVGYKTQGRPLGQTNKMIATQNFTTPSDTLATPANSPSEEQGPTDFGGGPGPAAFVPRIVLSGQVDEPTGENENNFQNYNNDTISDSPTGVNINMVGVAIIDSAGYNLNNGTKLRLRGGDLSDNEFETPLASGPG